MWCYTHQSGRQFTEAMGAVSDHNQFPCCTFNLNQQTIRILWWLGSVLTSEEHVLHELNLGTTEEG